MVHRTACIVVFLAVAAPAWGQGFQLLDTVVPDFSGDVAQDLTHPASPRFGFSVAAGDDWLLVGAPGYRFLEAHKPGMAAHFQRVGDEWQARGRDILTAGEFDEAECGHTVALAAGPPARDTAFGCPFANNVNTLTANTGAARLESEGGSAHTFFGSNEFSGFGWAVSMARTASGRALAAVGAPAEQKVFIFRRDPGSPDWSFLASVSPSSNTGGFGSSVSLAAGSDGNFFWLAVGAPDWSVSTGKVYVYGSGDPANQTWFEAAEITATNGQTFDEFGASVAYHPNGGSHENDLLVIGAPGRYTGGDTGLDHRRGTVSTYRRGVSQGDFFEQGDVRFFCLPLPTGNTCDPTLQAMRFGHSVAVDDEESIWIGAPYFSVDGDSHAGRAYRASYSPPTPLPNSGGWVINRTLSPGPPEDDCGENASRFSLGWFGWSLAPFAGGIAVGHPAHGCPGVGYTGQVRIYGLPDDVFADRFEDGQ